MNSIEPMPMMICPTCRGRGSIRECINYASGEECRRFCLACRGTGRVCKPTPIVYQPGPRRHGGEFT
jgi:DnaJ-class molecular chaperone